MMVQAMLHYSFTYGTIYVLRNLSKQQRTKFINPKSFELPAASDKGRSRECGLFSHPSTYIGEAK